MTNTYNFPNGLGVLVSGRGSLGRSKGTYKVFLLKNNEKVYNRELGFREEKFGQSWDQVLDAIELVQYCNPSDYEFLEDAYLY